MSYLIGMLITPAKKRSKVQNGADFLWQVFFLPSPIAGVFRTSSQTTGSTCSSRRSALFLIYPLSPPSNALDNGCDALPSANAQRDEGGTQAAAL